MTYTRGQQDMTLKPHGEYWNSEVEEIKKKNGKRAEIRSNAEKIANGFRKVKESGIGNSKIVQTGNDKLQEGFR